jgi:hypothetical protein
VIINGLILYIKNRRRINRKNQYQDLRMTSNECGGRSSLLWNFALAHWLKPEENLAGMLCHVNISANS